eukprot:g66781.t1
MSLAKGISPACTAKGCLASTHCEGQSRQHALVLREGAEPLDIKTYAYKPEDFSFTLPQYIYLSPAAPMRAVEIR